MLNVEELKKMVARNDWEGFKTGVEAWLKNDLTEEERAESFLDFMDLYLDVKNEIDEKYLENLDRLLEVASEIKKEKESLEKDEKVRNIKDKIKGL